MQEQQPVEVFKPTNGIVGCPCCLVTLIAKDVHSDISLSDHINVIRSVSNSQRDCFGYLRLDQLDDLRFLRGRGSAYDDSFALHKHLHQFV